ncbi:MAG: hypothetical protein V1817_02380 [Candidatus Micrarchaeota archaeon]
MINTLKMVEKSFRPTKVFVSHSARGKGQVVISGKKLIEGSESNRAVSLIEAKLRQYCTGPERVHNVEQNREKTEIMVAGLTEKQVAEILGSILHGRLISEINHGVYLTPEKAKQLKKLVYDHIEFTTPHTVSEVETQSLNKQLSSIIGSKKRKGTHVVGETENTLQFDSGFLKTLRYIGRRPYGKKFKAVVEHLQDPKNLRFISYEFE